MVSRGLAMQMDVEKGDKAVKAKLTQSNRQPHAYHTGSPKRNFFVKHLEGDLPIITPDQAKIAAAAVKVVPQGQPKKKS